MDETAKKPRISILMPSYNTGKFLRETLDSVVNQTYKDWELIVMDGGSTDDTLGILKEYSERYPDIRVFSEPDEGPYNAIQKAGAKARGEFIFVLAISDGYIDNEWYERCMKVMDEDNEISIVWGIPMDMTEEGKILGPVYVYAHFLKDETKQYKRPSLLKKIFVKVFSYLKKPSTALDLVRKVNPQNISFLRHMAGTEDVPQKRDWFGYWIETGSIFPDGNHCVSRKAFFDCLQPYRFGTREPGDWMGFYFCLNSKGYLSYCIPTPANFGRLHEGQLSQVVQDYNDQNRRDYFKNLASFKRKIGQDPESFRFVDREGDPVK